MRNFCWGANCWPLSRRPSCLGRSTQDRGRKMRHLGLSARCRSEKDNCSGASSVGYRGALVSTTRRLRVAATIAVAAGLTAALPTFGALSASSNTAPAIDSALAPVGLRPPPGANGVAPPESPEVLARIAAVDEFYALTPSERERGRALLGADKSLQAILGATPFTIVSETSWKDPDATEAKGVNFDLSLGAPLSTGAVRVPELGLESGVVRALSYEARFNKITAMTVLVSFVEGKVVQVLPTTEGSATVTYLSEVPQLGTAE